jgi:hypothetical protein
MNRLLIVSILIIYAVPQHVQAQHADLAKLKADAQRIVRVIGNRVLVIVITGVPA